MVYLISIIFDPVTEIMTITFLLRLKVAFLKVGFAILSTANIMLKVAMKKK